MKTDDLIAMLGTNVEPVDRRQVVRTVNLAIAAGAAAAMLTTIFALGVRSGLTSPSALAYLALKVVFTVGIIALSTNYLLRLVRPGGERKTPIALVALPFLGIVALAAVNLALAPSSHWSKLFLEDRWLECLLSIPIIAILPFAAIVWAVRRTAPTDLVRTGAVAGLLAGAVSATAFALHCTDDSVPFVALWYGGTIVLCTLAGATLGPRLLRW